jgi:membrane-associated phospholipid phosphatase
MSFVHPLPVSAQETPADQTRKEVPEVLRPLPPELRGESPAEPSSDPVPLEANFSRTERGAVTALTATDLAVIVVEKQNFIEPVFEFGEPSGLDVEVSNALYDGGNVQDQLLGGIPDQLGDVVFPLSAAAFASSDALFLHYRGEAWSGDPAADHFFWTWLEAYSLTLAATQAAKSLIDRPRPMVYFERTGVEEHYDNHMSFFSGHTSSSFVLASLASRRLTDRLLAGPLSGETFSKRWWVGRFVPALACYGVAGFIGYSRIVDQRHYISDVMVGALVGTGIGNWTYDRHFDAYGKPVERKKGLSSVKVSVVPNGVQLQGKW